MIEVGEIASRPSSASSPGGQTNVDVFVRHALRLYRKVGANVDGGAPKIRRWSYEQGDFWLRISALFVRSSSEKRPIILRFRRVSLISLKLSNSDGIFIF